MSDFDCKHIEEVKKYKNSTIHVSEYKDIVRTTNSWKEIAETLEVDVNICKRRWKYI